MITQNKLYWIAENILAEEFPDISHALSEPDGLLAIGGVLNPSLLLDAYRKGIFPWYSEGQPVMWWSPDPRCVLFPDELKISLSTVYKTLSTLEELALAEIDKFIISSDGKKIKLYRSRIGKVEIILDNLEPSFVNSR